MLSQTSEYALQATLYVAMHEQEGPVKLDRIAKAIGSPRNYLSKTLHLLGRAGVLRSERGPHGGFSLAVPADSLTLLQVIAPFDPVRLTRRCILGQGECSDETACAAHARWKPVSQEMHAFFSSTRVGDLIGSSAESGAADRTF